MSFLSQKLQTHAVLNFKDLVLFPILYWCEVNIFKLGYGKPFSHFVDFCIDEFVYTFFEASRNARTSFSFLLPPYLSFLYSHLVSLQTFLHAPFSPSLSCVDCRLWPAC